MLTNGQLFVRDPLRTAIPNDGVAKVVRPQTEQEWAVLRYELSSFICEGEYRTGLERILDTYLKCLGEPVQPAVWVSGFYGSGKSHLVRVLEYLWADVPFPGGATARGLARLPDDINAYLQELTIAGRRDGGLWSAAGTLASGAGDSVRLALLGIVFRSVGLPENYAPARFVLWLMQNGYYNDVRRTIEAQDKTLEAELRHMYVSPVLARALLDCAPGLAADERQVRELLRAQYPNASEITDDEMVSTLADVLALQSSTPGKLPCTLIVMDELQQFVGDNNDRMLRVQTAVEACCSRFGSRLLFVATGQAALQSTATLAKLQDRFRVQVGLSDKDVQTVVRQVVLCKAPDKTEAIRQVLEQCSGEIDRHMVGTRIGPMAEDRAVLVADYPLLPVRRRFWERVLRAVDRAGAAGQLRTQLRIVHETTREVAEKPLGTTIAADRIFGQLESTMLQTAILLREVDELIRKQDDGTPDGVLRSRLGAAIFLISQLPSGAGVDTGIRATVDTLADLLVEDLRAGSASLRQRIPDLLAAMLESGSLMLVGDEYRLQTREGAEWEGDYRGRFARISGDEARIAGDRATEFKSACGKALQGLTFTQGASKTPRRIEMHFTAEEPRSETGAVPIRIRDEWAVSEKTVREDAQAGGSDGATVYVFLPRRGSDDLKKALAAYAAATETLLARGTPATREGQEARAGMTTRQAEQRGALDTLIGNILKDAKVFQGGGNEVAADDLRGAVQQAAEASFARLYPSFAAGDDPKWDKALQRVQQGNNDPLSALGYQGDVDQHPVCRDILSFVGAAGKKGSDVQRQFTGSTYGWPKDTVDGALLTLVASGHLSAVHNGVAQSAQRIERARLGQTEFRREGVTVTVLHRIPVRKLLTEAGIAFNQNEEALSLPGYVAALLALAQAAGGSAPLPAPPDTNHLEDLKAPTGNALVMAAYEQHERLAREYREWKEAKQKASSRLPRWQRLQRLLKHAQPLSIHEEAASQAGAIQTQRALLSEPDAVPNLSLRLTDALREAIQAAREQHLSAYGEKLDALLESAEWQRLDEQAQQQIRHANDLGALPPIQVGNEEEVLAALDQTPLSEWENKTAALSERITRALHEATKRLEPAVVRVQLPTATLKTVPEVDAYLQAARETILQHIHAGHPVVL